jgi:hypothetical protein
VVASTIGVWQRGISCFRLPVQGLPGTISDLPSSNLTALSDALIRATLRAVKVNRRWSVASPYGQFDRELAGEETWTDLKLVDGSQWMLCTDDYGNVGVIEFAQAISTEAPLHSVKMRVISSQSRTPMLNWTGLVHWFRGPAVLSAQLQGSSSRYINRA